MSARGVQNASQRLGEGAHLPLRRGSARQGRGTCRARANHGGEPRESALAACKLRSTTPALLCSSCDRPEGVCGSVCGPLSCHAACPIAHAASTTRGRYRGAVTCHVVRSRACQTLLTISSTIPRDAGCKSHICCSLVHMSNPKSRAFSVNNELRLAERRREFDVDELCRLAAQSVGRSSRDINTFVKLAEGGFNRTFLVTMHDGLEMIARIPYPVTDPKFYAIASEVATMRFLRSSGLPVPEVYDYSPSSDNAAKTEYIFMEFVRGTKLSDVWMELGEPDIASVLRQLVQLESRVMSIPFTAGGSLYYTNDLEKASGKTGVLLDDERFCVGPDVRLHMWYGRRSQLDVDRGPCTPFSTCSLIKLSGTKRDYRRKRRGSARSSSSQGTGVSETVRPTAAAVPA